MRLGFSQCGEDHVLLALFAEIGVERGTYVDVGAHDPINISNTLLLHKRGWSGVNIDLNAAAIERFNRLRPTDINIHAAVSDTNHEVSVHTYSAPVLNRVASIHDIDNKAAGCFEPIATITMQARTLAELLVQHPPPSNRIDYLNVDCEGHDLEVLRSMDWERWRPAIVTVEALSRTACAALESFLDTKGYELTDKMHLTLFFCRRDVSRRIS